MLKNTSQLKASLEQFLGNAEALNASSAVAGRECLHVEVVAQEFVMDFHEPTRGKERKLESDQLRTKKTVDIRDFHSSI